MKRKFILALVLVWTSLFFFAPAAYGISEPEMKTNLPGAEFWEPYLEQSPVDISKIAEDPLSALRSFFTSSLLEKLLDMIRSYADVLFFLLLFAVSALLTEGTEDHALLNLICVCGIGVLLWEKLWSIAQEFCAQMEEWARFLTGFLPVYAGVLQLGGEVSAGMAASGFFLTILCGMAQLMALAIPPFLECYLALSITCCLGTRREMSRLCTTLGNWMQHGLSLVGKLLTALMGMQRISTVQLDRSTLRVGQFLAGTVPIVGQSFRDAAEAVLAGVQFLKSSLGIAAILILFAEFLPLYLGMLLHLGCLIGCGFLCGLSGNQPGEALLECSAQAVRCMMACTGLFFGLTVLAIFLLFGMGGI